ncbi:hypothetical protein [Leisingera sp. ANG-Vp]|uniref:hypothetical protein n=1 Tax=Leisingera sp. ANG-Vp TaxID=1577896 RepID=UPI0005801E21|nr:hypothetical protein [Leisingera sp. ANG-Vp]KIC20757.1 hypothetical protein RA20_07120 [Leisingera sp. ANG-Vp]
MKTIFLSVLISLGAAAANAAPSAKETCRNLAKHRDGEAPGMTMCLCIYDLAEDILDDDVRGLLFQSWNDGVDREEEANALKPKGRASLQIKKLEQAAGKKCLPF